jgi:hypothetical protein
MSDLFASGIRPAIDEHLLKLAAEKRDYGNYWSASNAGYCHRKLIFERLGVPHTTEDDPRLQRVFTAGHIFHDWIQKLTRDAGLSIAQEVELQDDKLMIRGHFGDLVLIKTPIVDTLGTSDLDELILYDYKTVNSKSFSYARATDAPMSYYHKMQLATYMYLLRSPKLHMYDDDGKIMEIGLENLSEARILKISKDDLRMDEQQLFWSDQLEQQVVKYWTELKQEWDSQVIPPCTCADHENGFMAREKFNPFYFNEQPCSMEWYEQWKAAQ